MDFKGYPRCNNGDVLIMLSPDKAFQLHAEMLRRHCKFFRSQLGDGGATLSTNAKRNGETVRWRFDMVQRPGFGEDGAGLIQRVHLDSMARPLADSRLAYNDLTQSNQGEPPLFAHYEKVFGIMYGQTFDLDSTNPTIEDLLQDVVGIIDVAKYLGCMTAIAHTINAALLGQGQVLWRSVQANPFAWVDLALRVRSIAIFTEAIIHLVGRWNSLEPDQISGLDPVVRKVCEQKHKELQMRLIHIDCRILKFYMPETTRPIGAPPKHIQRMSYANDIYSWMAMNLFRHWFASVIAVDQNRHAADGGYWFYSRLARGGNAYLEKTEVNKFHEKFPMSTRGEHVLDQTVNRLKDMIRPIVAEVMRSEANLDQERFPVEYLTCTVIKKEEVQALMEGDEHALTGWGEGSSPGARGKNKRTNEDLERQLFGAADDDDIEMIVKKKPRLSMGTAGANGGDGGMLPMYASEEEDDEDVEGYESGAEDEEQEMIH